MTAIDISIRAHAKINVFLRVLGRRHDGFHDIQSLLLPVSLHDLVVVRPAERLSVVVTGDRSSALAALPYRFALNSAIQKLLWRPPADCFLLTADWFHFALRTLSCRLPTASCLPSVCPLLLALCRKAPRPKLKVFPYLLHFLLAS